MNEGTIRWSTLITFGLTREQVLVVQDMLGLTFGRVAKFVRNFMKEQAGETAILDAFKAYHQAVQDGSFPAKEQTFQVEL